MANKVTLQEFTVKHRRRGNVLPRYIAAVPTITFIDLDGEEHIGLDQAGSIPGDWFQIVDVTLIGTDTYLSDAFTGDNGLAATVWNNEDTGAAYNFYLVSEKFKVLKTIAENIKISDGLDTTTLANLKSSSLQRGFFRPFFSYVTETDLAMLTNLAVKATNLVYGAVRLSTPAVNPLIPIVVGNNDTRIPTSLSANYDNSLSDAITEIGADNKDLLITENTTVPASLTVPANIRLNITNNALVSVASGQTLTVNALENPGNRQVFTGSGTVRLMPRAAERLNVVWWCGTDTSLDHTSGFQKAFANLTSNDGGTLFIPEGVWKVKELVVPSNSVIEGAGVGRDGIKGTTLQIANVASASWILKVSENFRQIVVRDLTLSAAASTTSSAFLLEGTAPNSGAGLELSNVLFSGTGVSAPAQFYLKDLGGTWEAIQLSFHHCTWIVPQNGKGFRCDTINTAVNFTQPFFFLSPGSTGAHINSGANINFTNPTWNGTGTLASTPVYSRTLNVDAVNGSNVVTLNSGSLTLNDLGAKVVVPGKLDSYIKVLKSTTIAQTEDVATATISDDDMDLSYLSPNSGMAYAAINLLGSHGTITISGSQDEGLQYFIVASGSQQQYPIGIINSNIQSVISLQGTQTLFSSGNSYFSQSIIDGASSTARIISIGDYVDRTTLQTYTHVSGSPTIRGVELDMPVLMGLRTGAMILQTSFSSNQDNFRQMIGMPTDIKHGAEYGGNPEPTVPVFGLGSAFSKQLFRLGRLDPASNEFDFYYDIERLNSGGDAGRLSFTGNQSGFKGYNFDSNVKALSVTRSQATALTSASTIALDASTTDIFTLTPSHNATLNITGMKAYQEITLKVLTSGTTSYTLTFGTNFAPTAALVTGTVSGKSYLVKFWTDGTTVFPSNKSNDVGDTDVRVNETINVKFPTVGAVGDGTTNDRTVLNTLVNTTLATKGGEIVFPHDSATANTDYAINSDITFPSNVKLNFIRGARLKIPTGVTVTINGEIAGSPLAQIFTLTGTGKVNLGGAKIKEIYPEWWGAKAGDSGFDNQPAIMAAIVSVGSGGAAQGSRIYFSQDNYYFSTPIVLATSQESITFYAKHSSTRSAFYHTLAYTGATAPAIDVSKTAGITFDNIRFAQHNVSFSGIYFKAGDTGQDTQRLIIQNCSFGGFGSLSAPNGTITYWVDLSYAVYSQVENTSFTGGQIGIVGVRVAYSNVITIHRNTFNGQSVSAIRNVGQDWIITNNGWNGGSPGIDDSGEGFYSRSATITGNYMEGGSGGTAWIKIRLLGGVISGHTFSSLTSAGVTIELVGDSQGVVISGNHFEGDVTNIGVIAGTDAAGIVVLGNFFESIIPYGTGGGGFTMLGNKGVNALTANFTTAFKTNALAVQDALVSSNNTTGIDFGFRTAYGTNTSSMFGVLVGVAGFSNRALGIQAVKNGDQDIAFLAFDNAEIGRMNKTGGLLMQLPLGYGTGSGGTVTQATSKSTGATLSKSAGAITMNAASLAADTIVSFTLTNTLIAANDVLILNHISGGTVGAYALNAQCGAGSAIINVRNNTAGALAEAVVIQFVLIKGASS